MCNRQKEHHSHWDIYSQMCAAGKTKKEIEDFTEHFQTTCGHNLRMMELFSSTCNPKRKLMVCEVCGEPNQMAYDKKSGLHCGKCYTEKYHPYLAHRKDYCENQDGRLGFVCTYTTPTPEQLLKMGLHGDSTPHFEVDHKNGDPSDNDPDNLQTFCSNCHTFKTFANKDGQSAGRKTLGLTH